MVLAQFVLDENYYRAIVTKIEGQKVLIKYVDYGNEEVSMLNRLYDLPDELKEVSISNIIYKYQLQMKNV